jgi:hypothetical protein
MQSGYPSVRLWLSISLLLIVHRCARVCSYTHNIINTLACHPLFNHCQSSEDNLPSSYFVRSILLSIYSQFTNLYLPSISESICSYRNEYN